MFISTNNNIDPIKICIIKIFSANAQDPDHYICSTEFNVKEPKSYVKVMQCPNTP